MYVTITRLYGANEWRSMPAADLATALNAPAALRSMSLTAFFGQLVAAGADSDELRPLWGYGEYVTRVSTALFEGDRAGLLALIATMPEDMSQTTADAITATVAANTLRAVDVHWPEDSAEGPPETVTEQDIQTWLSTASYTWTGSQWSYTG